jgi:hypothetical protein
MMEDAENSTSSDIGVAARSRLDVWAVVGEAYSIWFSHLGLWLKLSIIPFVFAALLSGVGFAWFPATPDSTGVYAALVSALFIAIMFVVEIPLLTAWHRVILAPGDAGEHRYRFGKREWRYALKSSLIMVYVLLAVAVLLVLFNIALLAVVGEGTDGGPAISLRLQELLSYAVILLAYVLVFRLIGHLVLALPALALGRRISRQDVKIALRSNDWRLVGIVVMSMLPTFVVGFAGLLVATGSASGLLDMASYLLALILAPVIVGVISIAYRDLVEKPDAAD